MKNQIIQSTSKNNGLATEVPDKPNWSGQLFYYLSFIVQWWFSAFVTLSMVEAYAFRLNGYSYSWLVAYIAMPIVSICVGYMVYKFPGWLINMAKEQMKETSKMMNVAYYILRLRRDSYHKGLACAYWKRKARTLHRAIKPYNTNVYKLAEWMSKNSDGKAAELAKSIVDEEVTKSPDIENNVIHVDFSKKS